MVSLSPHSKQVPSHENGQKDWHVTKCFSSARYQRNHKVSHTTKTVACVMQNERIAV